MKISKYLTYLPESIKRPVSSSSLYKFYRRLLLRRLFLKNDSLAIPNKLTIELTNRCNLKCIMCPHPTMGNLKVKDMDFKIFKKIVDEVCKFGDKKSNFTTVGLGEPLMYAKFPESMEYIKMKCPDASIYLNTNGTLLNEENAKMLCKLLGGEDRLLISLNAGSRDVYEELMGGDKFDLVVNNIKNFLIIREKIGNGPKVTLQLLKVKKTESEIEKFKNFWKPLLGRNDEIFIKPLLNWGGTVDIKDIQVRENGDRYPCPSLWNSGVIILADGNVYACCAAQSTRGKSDLLLGNVQEKSLSEIKSENKMKDIQKKHLRGQWNEYSDCVKCDMWSFNENIWFKIGGGWY